MTSLPHSDSPAGPAAIATGAARVSLFVGLGASAGGLDALEQFVARLPPRSGMAFVVVTHMDPTQPALLAQLLQRVCALPVAEAVEGLHIAADHVYVIPPNKELTVVAGCLRLAPHQQRRGQRLPVDLLFESLALDQRERAAGVVLSGMGSDGSLGVQAIKRAGGLVLAQQPDSAQFDAMPGSAIRTGCVDRVGTPAQLAVHLLALAGAGAPAPAPSIEDEHLSGDPDALQGILALLNSAGRHDFSLYKRRTLARRIERRMGVHKLHGLAAYEALLRGSPQECSLLVNELLIGVTGFFRDRAVWQRLQDEHLPGLLRLRPDGHPFRAWVAGCSTGEEAYSLAMVFREVQEAMPERSASSLQIFASDLSEDAIERARRGLFAAGISGEVSAQRLQRFFKPEHGEYRISKSIREMVVFAPHDLISDPPFTKLDLLSCRNLLIYFTAPLQNRLLPLFHYSLRSGGLLLLGSSESIGRFGTLFEPLDAQSRLYRRLDAAGAPVAPDFPIRSRRRSHPSPKETPLSEPRETPSGLQASAEQLLLQEFSPPAVLVNEHGDILYINGRTGKYLEPAAGKANWNIHVMAREGLRGPLDDALRRARAQPEPVEVPGLALGDGLKETRVDITVRAVAPSGASGEVTMIVFREVPTAGAVPAARGRRSAAQLDLEAQLQRMRLELQTLREDMRVTQEELQASNEELQSTNEELTSSKEELQSMNEELQAVNVELQSKLDDLELAQSDMKNLLNSTEIATLFLDRELNVRRFTEQAQSLIKLRDSDVGRPLSDLSSSLDYPGLKTDAQQTLRTLASSEKQVASSDGRWFNVRIMPYRSLDDAILGVVITFIDISATKRLEARLGAAPASTGSPSA
ncbi:MAG: PAS domain-containing protein [Burkholderiaceae bacterium]|nr:PAS domain-containing protein [Burkholderiaceae bacterium]